ncbi:MAG: EAL domain-containing protein [Arenibacterium sp.]
MNAPRKNKQHKGNARSNPLHEAVEGRDAPVMSIVADAIKHREVVLAYQPIMQAKAPFDTAFYEGFVRVLDATGRIIPARQFMAEVEATELGRQLDCIALEQGLRVLQRNLSQRLSINMSARSIGYAEWSRVLDRFLRKDAALGERLMLEIDSDSAMHMPELVVDFMDRLQPMGIAFALDNFGRGATIMRHFRDFFFDAVKIDGQFVQNAAVDHDNAATIRSLVAIAREFEMLVIANNVERLEDAEFLAQNGVDCLQGQLFGAASVTPPWLETKTTRKSA